MPTYAFNIHKEGKPEETLSVVIRHGGHRSH